MNTQAAQTNAVPPKLKATGRAPLPWLWGALGLGAVGIGLLVFTFDPSQTPFYPGCMFHRITGLNCPGCGATRAVYAVLHGRWQVAMHDNALFMLTGLALALRAAWLGLQRLRQRPRATLIPTSCLIPWLILALIFGVARNFPAFAFLSP